MAGVSAQNRAAGLQTGRYYLETRAQESKLPNVGDRQVKGFEKNVRKADRTNGGNALSLGWPRLDKNRPDEDTRHAIRDYLLASIYSGDIEAVHRALRGNR
jgi:hypothetical protein